MDALKEWLRPEVVWFILGLVFLIAEFMMPGLIIFFFGVGAVVVGVVCLVTDISLNWQLTIFLVSSVVSLVLLRKSLAGVFGGHIGGKQSGMSKMDDFVGSKAKVIETISLRSGGKVELHGTHWEAEADGEIAEGAMVEVVGKDNLTLKVKAI